MADTGHGDQPQVPFKPEERNKYEAHRDDAFKYQRPLGTSDERE